MRFIFAYFSVLFLGLISAVGIGGFLTLSITAKLIFIAILFATPIIVIGATAAEIVYNFSTTASAVRFFIWGFIFGVIMLILVTSILHTSSIFLMIATVFMGGLFTSLLSLAFFFIRGGKSNQGQVSKPLKE